MGVEYEFPIDPGESSLPIDYEHRRGDGVATGRTVSLDTGGRPASIPAAWRDALAPYHGDGITETKAEHV